MVASITKKTGQETLEAWEQAFRAFEKSGAAASADWFRPVRKKAAQQFKVLGIPSKRDEQWKYTSTAFLGDKEYRFASAASKTEVSSAALQKSFLGGEDWPRLVFVDGRYRSELSSPGIYEEAVSVENLCGAVNGKSRIFREHLGRYAGLEEKFFPALNTAFLQETVFIHLKKGFEASAPLHVLHWTSDSAKPASATAPRHLIVAEANARATVIESYIAQGAAAGIFENAVTEIVLEEGAALDYYKIHKGGDESYHIGTVEVRQARASRLQARSFAMEGRFTRNDLHVNLDDEGAECILDGFYWVSKNRHVDNHLLVDHLKPQGTSEQLYKGILDGKSRAVFNGKVFVHQDAQKTDARQTNKNLLLSESATVDTKPELEIYADDVKCSHGAAVGQIDQNALFYFRSRGINEANARKLICYGFACEVLNRIPIESLRAALDQWLQTRLEHA